MDKLLSLLKPSSALSMDAVSHKFALLSRESLHAVSSKFIISPLTDAIKSRLSLQFRHMTREEQIKYYVLLSGNSRSMTLAGTMFETMGQDIIQKGTTLDIIPMVKLDKPRKRWHSSHQPLSKSIEIYRQDALSHRFSKKIVPSRTEEFYDNDELLIIDGVFYRPIKTNQKILDSFIMLGNELFVFQFTIAQTHDIKLGLIDFFKRCSSVPALENWKFVFIIDKQTVKCPQPQELAGLDLYSAVMDVKKHSPILNMQTQP